MTKRKIDDPKYQLAVEKFEKAKRRSTQDKKKGSKAAEAKIADLSAQVSLLSSTVLRLRKFISSLYRVLPAPAKEEFERLKDQLNDGTIDEVHP